jgi:hypothetical protein
MAADIFISRPSVISEEFEEQYIPFEKFLRSSGVTPCRLGAGQYTLDAPLKGVMDLMERCKGSIILGYPQYHIGASVIKGREAQQTIMMNIPTPWNQIEATLAFQRQIPVLVIAHSGVTGGIFDHGVTGEYVLTIDLKEKNWHKKKEFLGIFEIWKAKLELIGV